MWPTGSTIDLRLQLTAIDGFGGIDAIQFGHLDVGHQEIQLFSKATVDEFLAIPSRRNNLVPEFGKDTRQVPTHIGFIVGDGHS